MIQASGDPPAHAPMSPTALILPPTIFESPPINDQVPASHMPNSGTTNSPGAGSDIVNTILSDCASLTEHTKSPVELDILDILDELDELDVLDVPDVPVSVVDEVLDVFVVVTVISPVAVGSVVLDEAVIVVTSVVPCVRVSSVVGSAAVWDAVQAGFGFEQPTNAVATIQPTSCQEVQVIPAMISPASALRLTMIAPPLPAPDRPAAPADQVYIEMDPLRKSVVARCTFTNTGLPARASSFACAKTGST